MTITLDYDDFVQVPFMGGTVQNICEKATIEITTDETADTGLVLYPHQIYKWTDSTIYARAKWSAGEVVKLAAVSMS
jgi:hypothetical protein